MALRKEPERRYRSVAQLIDDIESYLADRPVAARSDSLVYRTGKLMRRHKASFATAVAALVLLAGLIFFYTVRLADERDRAQLAAAQATQVSSFLRGLFEVSAPTRSRGEQVTARELLDRGAGRIERELAGQPELQAAMMTLMGNVYRELALYEEAVPLLERAVAARRRQPGQDGLELAESVHALAGAKEELGEHEVARQLYREALELREAALSPEHPEVARSVDGLGRVLNLQGEFEPALEHHRRALRIFESRLGADHPEVGWTLTGLGEVLGRIREFDESRAVLERALGILEEGYGSDHPRISHARVFLANALRFTGDVGSAREQYEKALASFERIGGSRSRPRRCCHRAPQPRRSSAAAKRRAGRSGTAL
ncbi:MAG: tetratricopeptide repeat protein [Thermoanaerobaculia bacterium]